MLGRPGDKVPEIRRIRLRATFFRQVSSRHSPLWHRPLPLQPQVQEASRFNWRGTDYVQYMASTPDGAWAELIRHFGIEDEDDLARVSRVFYALVVDENDIADLTELDAGRDADRDLLGHLVGDGEADLEACRELADELASDDFRGLLTPSSALPGVHNLALFGPRSEHLVDSLESSEGGPWRARSRIRCLPLALGRPPYAELLEQVRSFDAPHPLLSGGASEA